MVALIYKVVASILDAFWMTHLHYCQLDTASENWFLRPAGYDLETDRKRDKWVNGKALNRKRERPIKFTTASLGSWHQFKSCADGVIQSLESEENDEAAYR